MIPVALLRALRLALSVVGVPVVCLIFGRPVWPAWALALGAPLVWGAFIGPYYLPLLRLTDSSETGAEAVTRIAAMKHPWTLRAFNVLFSLAWWVGLVLALGWGRVPC